MVKESFVSSLVYQIKQDKDFLQNKYQKLDKSEREKELIVKVANQILGSGNEIWRASQVQDKVLEDHGVRVSESKVKQIFKDELSLKFKKIKHIPFLGNAQRCLVMRNLYARKMIDALLQEKTIWNFDESFLSESSFVRSKWCQKGQQNSMPQKSISPRISVFLVMNNHGEAYMSLSQSVTDNQRVILFFQYFFKLLDLAQPDWRETSILLMDGASYHINDETQMFMRRNNVNLYFSAPYSYDAAACEMFFSYLKNKDLNPEKLKLGKRQVELSNLTQLDLFKMQLILWVIGSKV